MGVRLKNVSLWLDLSNLMALLKMLYCCTKLWGQVLNNSVKGLRTKYINV